MNDKKLIARLNSLAAFLSKEGRSVAASWCREAAKRLQPVTFVGSETRTAKAFYRKVNGRKTLCSKSPFDGRVSPVPKGHYLNTLPL